MPNALPATGAGCLGAGVICAPAGYTGELYVPPKFIPEKSPGIYDEDAAAGYIDV